MSTPAQRWRRGLDEARLKGLSTHRKALKSSRVQVALKKLVDARQLHRLADRRTLITSGVLPTAGNARPGWCEALGKELAHHIPRTVQTVPAVCGCGERIWPTRAAPGLSVAYHGG